MSISRTIVLAVAILVSTVAVGCAARADSDDGTIRGPVDETVHVWIDRDGPFICPPGARLTTSTPPLCSVGPTHRVRLSGHPLFAFLSEGGWRQPSDLGSWLGTAHIVGLPVDDGRTIETESIERT